MISDQGTQLKAVPARTLDDVKRDYAIACGEAGDLQHLVLDFKEKLNQVNQRLSAFKREHEEIEAKSKIAAPPVAQDAHEAEGHPLDGTKAP